MGEQLGLGLTDLGNVCLRHLGNVLIILLPGTPQQRLIGGVRDQRMLEAVRRVRRQPP
jgi:hypothetical protein